MLIDSHCHLHDREFFTEKEAEEILEKARKKGVKKIICIGTSHEDSLAAKAFAESHENVYWTYGIHPEYTSDKTLEEFSAFRSVAARELAYSARGDGPERRGTESFNALSRIVGIGEIGLDYHYSKDKENQQKLFRQLLDLAEEKDLPVSFHVREAFDDFFEIIKDYPKIKGVVHSFSDSKKNLKKILEQTNFYVGVNGLATYSTLPTPPLDRIILETDTPFLAPVPLRGEKNDPSNIKEVADWLAQKFDTTPEEIAKITTQNVENLFKI